MPDARGVPHAVDISHSVPGAPFWEARYGQFDVMAQARAIGGRMIAGTESRVKYLVANFGGYDQILNPSVAPYWRQNGNPKTEHKSHLHVSFTVAAENSTAPFFGAPEDDVTEAEMDRIADKVVARLGRQKDGSTGVIGDEVSHVFGGYVADKWEDAALLAKWRKDDNLSKS